MLQQGLVAAVLIFCCAMSLLCHTPSAYGPVNHACCEKYTRKHVPFGLIKGFRQQSSLGVCRIDAIILYTQRKKVCVSADDDWVQEALKHLGSRLSKIANKPKVGKSIGNTTVMFANSSSNQ